MILKKGSNQFKNKYKLSKWAITSIVKLILLTLFISLAIKCFQYYSKISYYQWRDANIISPCDNFCNPEFVGKVQAYYSPPEPTVDEMIDKYSKKYCQTNYGQNRVKAMAHYLLLRESNYGATKNCGDSGLACGPAQFHLATYKGYRKIMLLRGLVTTEGDRLNMHDAIQTMIWAICDGREDAWGPIARGEGF